MKPPILCFILLCCGAASAQNDLTKFFPAGEENAGALIEEYIGPVAEDLGVLINNGWYTTAKTHNKFGVDFTITLNNVLVSSDRKYFDMPSGLSGISFDGTTAGGSKVPTAYGPEDEYPVFQNTAGLNAGTTFEGPDGFEPGKSHPLDAQVLPTLQLGIGLFKNTDLRIRYTPRYEINNVKVDNWGIGLMHDIKQHIPVLKELPFSWSLFLGYTRLNGTVDHSGEFLGENQEGKMNGNGITVQTIISKSFKIVTFYGSLGYQRATVDYKVNGTYMVGTPGGESDVLLIAPFTLTDPYDFSFSTQSIRGTAGIQFKFGPVLLNSDFTYAHARSIVTAGFGFTFN
jgi:hypothetical protein